MRQTVAEGHSRSTPVTKPDGALRRSVGARLSGFLGLLRGYVPALLVWALVGGLFYYGHHVHWRLPKFSTLTGAAAMESLDWCEAHNVPESRCVTCNPDLMPAGPDYGWCVEHGVHNCTLDHPDVAQVPTPLTVAEEHVAMANDALALRSRSTNNAACRVYQMRIQFASIDAVQQAGIDVTLVDHERVREWALGNGEIRYDATRFASLASRSSGTVSRVYKTVGDQVEAGEVLAVVDAVEVGRLKGELLKAIVAENLARTNADRLSQLAAGVVPGKEVLEAEAELARAKAESLSAEQALANLGLSVDVAALASLPQDKIVDHLRFLGFPKTIAKELRQHTASANLIPVRSPLTGVVVKRKVVAGEVVSPAITLFEVADASRMWLMLNVSLEEANLLQLGQSVEFVPNGGSDTVSGHVTWISTAADRQTRMVSVRAELDNETGRLRDETFGTGRILLRETPAAVVVPREAVHWEGCCQIVFVRDKSYFEAADSPKVFHVRTVRTGATLGNDIELIAGVLPGEVVVTRGSDVLRAQLLKNNLGEGCCAE